ncbi:MAG: NarK/NasA family nitrate transporter [Planctomycetota bacterium]|nr:MAG: NarK/NasA family nitrate transporter [Planctomycetota bacterium]REJ96452.1 MAG: NarK/NasA family nitrate transporter [Planctomycetota bacterium]REK25096.1 MAG: NarK/NasA family nitrate transporter [Planctomycetota bacterium]REK44664.1 MAG: NarK/NasA family nitrate transporter [Planctomycetota bacterium]
MAATPEKWDVEDQQFWESTGKPIAYRNLWISIPNLLCGFSVWLYWGMIIKTMQELHFANTALFNFTFRNDGLPYDEAGYKALLYTLPAVAGLAGATLRIPNSFMIAICGGRNVKFMTTVMLIIPAIASGIALKNPETPFSVYIVLAALSGVGGGAFASSMSNISFFFPKRMQGLSLGLNAGLGNAGVSVMQFLIPWAITFGMFGGLGGDPQAYPVGDATKQVWIQNAALVWVPIMIVLAILAWTMMNNLPQHKCGSAPVAIGKYLWLQAIGFLGAAVGVLMLIYVQLPIPELVRIFLVLIVAVFATLLGMRFMTPQAIQQPLNKQFSILRNKHNWVMTWLYVMTFGSFIGYANAFPKLLNDVFVTPDNGLVTAHYIWIGAFVGALIRPLGGWLSDKLGGARVTQWDTWIMVASTILAGYFVAQARQSSNPETYFIPFLLTFIVLFATTGIGNGSTFRMIPIIFSKEQAGPVLGWTSAIAAYGAYLIPKIFATQIKAGTPEYALYGFAGYYATCLAVNWWFYARKNAEIKC